MRLIAVLLLFSGLCGAQKIDLLVQGAVDGELQPLLAALTDKKEITIAAWTFWTGRIGAKSVVISRTEMGPINAAAATALGIERFHPTAIVNQGTAGAHNPKLALWDIVVGERTTDYGAFKSAHRADLPRRRFGHDRGVAHGHFDGSQLYRKLGGRGGGRKDRSHRHRDRTAVPGRPFHRAAGGGDPIGGYRAGADHRGQLHGVGRRRD